MKKILLLFMSSILFFSCKFEKHIKIEYGKKNCTKKIIDAVYNDEYLTKYDTCNKYKRKFYRKYFTDNKLIMEGYSERYSKEGVWRFYNKKGDTITKVNFKNSELTGNSKFKNLDTISWGIFALPNKGFRISKPKRLSVLEEDENTFYFDDKNGNGSTNLSFRITMHLIDDIDGEIIDIYNNTVSQKQNHKRIQRLKFKKVNISDYKESYQITNEEIQDDKILLIEENIIVYKDRFYYIQIIQNKQSKYDYTVMKEIIKNSFKVYDTIIPDKVTKLSQAQ
ncbi:hypothetical protein [uncultured Polaribacter sp.]|uniref:hypothetical protein n=1 Tax=uncultured Polaribacter sp. TaxID=174711 RepID=UPI0026204162|nr:hypothetical protein [uncultured Polaribacter sp.]